MREDYTLITIRPEDLATTELVAQLSGMDPEEEPEAYRIRFSGERTQNSGGIQGEVLFVPGRGRAGIAWAGEVLWTDASSADEAMDRYLDHNVAEDNNPGL